MLCLRGDQEVTRQAGRLTEGETGELDEHHFNRNIAAACRGEQRAVERLAGWARTLGVSGPQWMILMALADLDQGEGVPVKVVSKMLHVDPSFVTTQSKMLEKKGFMRRKTSGDDARVVQMSLTDKTYKHIASLASQQEELNNFIFAESSSSPASSRRSRRVWKRPA